MLIATAYSAASVEMDAAAFHNNFERTLIALGVTLVIMLMLYAIQEFGMRAWRVFGVAALALGGVAVWLLFMTGLI